MEGDGRYSNAGGVSNPDDAVDQSGRLLHDRTRPSAQVAPQKRVRSRFRGGGAHLPWATRQRVYLRLPRGLRTPAAVRIECEPFTPPGAPMQTIGASLNGTPIGQVTLRSGWRTARFPTSARAWRIGHNDVQLFFKYRPFVGVRRSPRRSHRSYLDCAVGPPGFALFAAGESLRRLN